MSELKEITRKKKIRNLMETHELLASGQSTIGEQVSNT
jgi:hypothetical protein